MKHFSMILIALVIAAPALANDNDEQTTVTGIFQTGGTYYDADGSPDLVSEWDSADSMPLIGVEVESDQDWGHLFVAAHFRNSDDSQMQLDFDIRRMVRSHTSFNKFFHRLGHDPMTNLEATSINGKVTEHTDFNPMMDYDLSYSVLDHRTEFQFPSIDALTVAIEVKEQKRWGHRQAFTTSHCDTCHVKSQSHPLDERTTDATLEARVAWAGGFAKANYTKRAHRQGVNSVQTIFDDALHPEMQVPIFDNRLQYDSAEGWMAADLWPDQDKDTARFDLHFDDLGGFVVNGGAVFSETENKYTNLKSDYAGYLINAARRFGNNVRLAWRGRVYSIDNDDVFVDTNERVSIAGAHVDQTYEDVYGENFDFWRLSAMNRDVIESKVDLAYRINRSAGTIKGFWKFSSVDRENYQVLPGELETTTNVLGLSWRARPTKSLKLSAIAKHGEIDNAFMLIDGACSTLVSDPISNPWNPDTAQYDLQHDLRIAETTASPSSWDELRAAVTWTAGKTMITGSYRWKSGDNNDGDLTDWSRTSQTAALTLWSAPSELVEWYLGYNWLGSEVDAPVCTPVMDG